MSKQIPLTQGKFATVDDEDYEWLIQWKWFADRRSRNWYAVRVTRIDGKSKNIYMHKIILGFDGGTEIDHRDRNGLNNQRCNLRPATHIENARNHGPQNNNKSGYKGVSFYKRDKNWEARIKVNNAYKFLGRFSTPEDAARIYDKAAKELFGEFAWLNFPDEKGA